LALVDFCFFLPLLSFFGPLSFIVFTGGGMGGAKYHRSSAAGDHCSLCADGPGGAKIRVEPNGPTGVLFAGPCDGDDLND
jgi:hypothetical protein